MTDGSSAPPLNGDDGRTGAGGDAGPPDGGGADGAPLVLGVATSAYQIEGGVRLDGRGESIWDRFTGVPGAILDGTSAATATGSYERLEDDLDLIAGLGVAAYRFSIAWPRVQPGGTGRANAVGLDYYDRVVDGLRARGVAPMPTLYHWDLPQPLEDAGGWPVRDTAERFADYATLVVDRLGDRVTRWATHNEPWCAAFLGYAAGVHAPGRREPAAAYAAAHHLLLGHGLAAQRLRAVTGTEVGIVLNLTPVRTVVPAAAAAARAVDAVQNGLWLGALLDGAYPEDLLAIAPTLRDPAVVREGDLGTVAGTLDWLGVNYYTPFRVDVPPAGAGSADPTGVAAAATDAPPAPGGVVPGGAGAAGAADGAGVGQDAGAYPGAPPFAFRPGEPRTAMGWEVDPSGLEELLVGLAGRAPGLPLWVTENGAAFDDTARAEDGTVNDDDRIAYLREHLAAVDRARQAGADVRGYLAWSLLDNFEWAEGFTKRFGLVEVEPNTLTRLPKASYRWLAAHAAAARRG